MVVVVAVVVVVVVAVVLMVAVVGAAVVVASSIPSLRVENGAINLPPPSYSVSGCNLSLTPGLKSEMFPLFVYCSTPCLSRPSSSTLAFRCPRQCNLRIFV